MCVYLKPILLFSDGVKKGPQALVIRGLKGGTEKEWWGCVGMGGMAGREAASKL